MTRSAGCHALPGIYVWRSNSREAEALTEALDKPEWLDDARFLSPALRDRNIDDRLAMTQEVLATNTSAHWLERLEAAGVPCAPVLTRADMIDHPQIAASGLIVEADHPTAGRIRQTRTAARFEGTPPETPRPAPGLGEHTDKILGELGLSVEEIAGLRTDQVVGG